MRRRITITIVAVVAGALLVTGLGTWVLARRGALTDAERSLTRQATAISQAAEDARRPAAITVLRQALKLEDAALSRYQPLRGTWAALPAGVTDADLAGLQQKPAVSGHHGSLAFAAGGIEGARARSAVVLTRRVTNNRSGAGFFLIAAAIALAIAAAVGDRLGRRITKPLTAAQVTTRRIADGDLDARLATDDSHDPELASLAASINSMAENLQQASHLQRQFLLSVSHDLRTPLTSIRGFAEAIADGATTDTVRAAGVIAAEGRRLERLVGDLLDLARLDARQFTFDLRPVDIGEVAADSVAGFQLAAAEIPLTLTMDANDESPVLAVADPDRLAQVVANLVENAMAWAATRVDVVVEGGGRNVVLAVTDDGPGIPPEDLGRVFDRLYQSPRTGDAVPRRVGSGLGLAIVAELVGAMHGKVHATAGPSGGTRMIVTLPSEMTAQTK